MTFSLLKKKILCRSDPSDLDDALKGGSKELPCHVGIILDGNGRWAKKRGLPRIAGHHQGKKTLERIGEEVQRLGIKYLTVYAFSSENWLRPKEEVSALMQILQESLKNQVKDFVKRRVRLRFIGDLTRVSEPLKEQIKKAEEDTAHLEDFHFTIALSYGGRQEIAQAAQALAQQVQDGKLKVEDIDEKALSQVMYTRDLPDPDLIIRTSGVHRTSNFLTWQSIYSEWAFVEKYWPEFSVKDLHAVLKNYQKTERRYGKISEQL